MSPTTRYVLPAHARVIAANNIIRHFSIDLPYCSASSAPGVAVFALVADALEVPAPEPAGWFSDLNGSNADRILRRHCP